MELKLNTATLDDVGPSPIVERIVHGVVWALLGVSIVGIAFIFGFDPANWFSVDNASAGIRAVGVDLTFYGGLYFARRFWNRQRRTFGDFCWGCFWFFVAFCAASLSWFANSLFIARQHLVTQDLLISGGFSWVNAQLVNQVVGAIPIAIILLYSVVPRQQKADNRTPEQIMEESRRRQAMIHAKNAERAAMASEAGAGVRGVLGGFVNQAFNLDEKKAQAALDEQKREDRRLRRENRDRMQRLANIHGLDAYAADLEEQLTARGLWGPAPAKQEEAAITSATDTAKSATIKQFSGPQPTMFTASEIAKEIGKPVRSVSRWMSPEYKGPYKIHYRFSKSRNARCATASEVARIVLLLRDENAPADVPEEETAQPAPEQLSVLMVGQVEGQPQRKAQRQTKGHLNGHTSATLEGQEEGQ
jgi:hypothetical protein